MADVIRVILVDDDEEDALIVRTRLREVEGARFALTVIDDWDRALSTLLRHEHDVALLDQGLGERTGLELLREATSRGCSIPLILLTGRADRAIDVEAMRAGAADYLDKSQLTGPLLERTLRYAIEHTRTLRTLRLFAAAVEQATDGVVITDARPSEPGPAILYVNEAFTRMTGWKASEVIGRTPRILQGPRTNRAVLDALRRAIEIGESFIGESVNYRKDGREFDMEWRVTPVRNEVGEVTHFVAFQRDVSDRNRLQAQLMLADRMASVGTLAAGVAHEINNPLAYVISNLGFATAEIRELGQALPPERARELLEVLEEAREGAGRVRHVVRDLRTFARSDETASAPVDLKRALEFSLNMAMNDLKHRARVVREFGDVPPVLASEARLGQVFLNLVVNAAHAMAPANLATNRLTVRAFTEGHRVIAEVEDTGEGIPEAMIPRVFEPFFTTKPPGVGTGLGLSISRSIIAGFGGTIEITSRTGEGTRVRVSLPAAAEQPPAPRVEAAPRHVLLVDDDPRLGAAVRRALGSEFRVEVEVSGRAALKRIERGDAFDLVMFALVTPDLTGMDLESALKERCPELLGKVVYLSPLLMSERARRFWEALPEGRRLDRAAEPARLLAAVRAAAG